MRTFRKNFPLFAQPCNQTPNRSASWRTGFFYFCKLSMLFTMAIHKPQSYIIGIDEVGRGPLAGPVVVCAVAIPRTLRPTSITKHTPLRDSKKLTAKQRAAWATAIKNESRIFHSVASVSAPVIDRTNITRAANRAATRALINLLAILPSPTRVTVFLDGGLFVYENPNIKIQTSKPQTRVKKFFTYTDPKTNHPLELKIETVIKGDETIPAISFASIVAKEHRDALMRRMHKKYPDYGFDHHSGYGTRQHIAAIKQNGHTPLHRKSFLKKIA